MSSRFFQIIVVFALLALSPALAKPHDGVTYVKTVAAGVPLHLVDVDMERDDLVVRPVVVPTGQRAKFGKMVQKHRPLAAVNGTFFDTKTNIIVGNLVSEGRLLAEGMTGSNLVFGKDGSVTLLSSSRNLGRYKDWSQVEFAVGGGPTLLSSGEFFMNPSSEGFRDPSLFKPRPRAALGVTEDGHLRMVVVTQPVTLWKLAKVMKALRCRHAINLDGGTSTGLSVGGTTMVRPGRKLTNLIGVFAAHMEPQLKRATQVAESRALAHFRKGQTLASRGKVRLARSQLRQAVSKSPRQAAYWKALGLVEWEAGNFRQAGRDLVKAGWIYLERGNPQAAFELAAKLLARDPNSTAAHLLSGECLMRQNRDDLAEKHLRVVLTNCPGHPKATRLMETLSFRKHSIEKLESSGEAVLKTLSIACEL